MPTTTANGLIVTAVRGVPNTWIVRTNRSVYWAIQTDGTPIDRIDTTSAAHDTRWSVPGAVTRTHAYDYDSTAEGRELAGWYVEFHNNSGEPYRRGTDALSVLKMQIRDSHNTRKARP